MYAAKKKEKRGYVLEIPKDVSVKMCVRTSVCVKLTDRSLKMLTKQLKIDSERNNTES